ncbi:hypothetical protein Ddc_10526 [Ditylenchus destructor]|nr:hypothetical protein Ddc_10526 [Ditylenchus destructor]
MQRKLVAQLILFIFSTQITRTKCGGQLELQLENRPPSSSVSPSSSDTIARTNDLASLCNRQLFGGCIIKICAREFRWKSDTNSEAAIVVDKNSSIADRQAVMRRRCKYGDGIMDFAASDDFSARSLKLDFSSSWKGSFNLHIQVKQKRSNKSEFLYNVWTKYQNSNAPNK